MSYESNVSHPSNQIEIEETMKRQATGIICVDICGIILFIVVSAVTLNMAEGNPIGVLIVLFIWICMAVLILFSYRYIRKSGKIRRFIITDEFIIIQIPDVQPFRANLSDFNSIEVRRRITGVKYTKKAFYNFTFTGPNYSSSYEIESQKDFSRKAIKKFREQLEEFSAKKGIQYSFRKRRFF